MYRALSKMLILRCRRISSKPGQGRVGNAEANSAPPVNLSTMAQARGERYLPVALTITLTIN